jgi:cell division septation protein DedD
MAAGLLPAATAWADAKAGVDAWSRGDYPAAIREWQAGVAHGDADAEFNMGQAYMLGRGVTRDLVRAETLFAKAAAQGHLRAGDNYGLLLFQRGEHAKAMPYIKAASDRGDPRAMYLYGLALFNGENVPKDWVRAYALVSLAQQNGLPQAKAALAQMDQYIPLEQRRRGVAMSSEIAAQADANRARQLAAQDLGSVPPMVSPVPPAPMGSPAASTWEQPWGLKAGETPPASGTRLAVAPPHARPATDSSKPAPHPHAPPPPPPAAPPAATAGGEWRIQLGAFGVPSNAEALWNKLKSRPEISGHARINAKSGRVIKLQAGGYSKDSAETACRGMTAAGLTCVVVKD